MEHSKTAYRRQDFPTINATLGSCQEGTLEKNWIYPLCTAQPLLDDHHVSFCQSYEPLYVPNLKDTVSYSAFRGSCSFESRNLIRSYTFQIFMQPNLTPHDQSDAYLQCDSHDSITTSSQSTYATSTSDSLEHPSNSIFPEDFLSESVTYSRIKVSHWHIYPQDCSKCKTTAPEATESGLATCIPRARTEKRGNFEETDRRAAIPDRGIDYPK
jgi:hypothetical protein